MASNDARTNDLRNLSWEQVCKLADSQDGIDARVYLDACRKHIENQRKEIARLRPDAERYRWFRDHPDTYWEIVLLFQKRPTVVMKFPFESMDRVPASLDVAVDHARSLSALKEMQP